MGSGSERELRLMLSEQVMNETELLSLEDRLSLYALLDNFTTVQTLLEPNIYRLDEISDDTVGITKWYSSFLPMDGVVGGLYQGILILLGKPGSGKTSLMMIMAHELARADACSSILFVENEIPGPMMLWRFQPLTQRGKFRKEDLLICASWSSKEIIQWVVDHPDPDRVIFFDSPDVVTGDVKMERRFVLERVYQDLVKLKQISKLVVVSSHVRRTDRNLTQESVSEAWLKAYYADMMVTIGVFSTVGSMTEVRLRCVKNRFGQSPNQFTFRIDFDDLNWLVSGEQASDEEDLW
jgi:hypothetical protein